MCDTDFDGSKLSLTLVHRTCTGALKLTFAIAKTCYDIFTSLSRNDRQKSVFVIDKS